MVVYKGPSAPRVIVDVFVILLCTIYYYSPSYYRTFSRDSLPELWPLAVPLLGLVSLLLSLPSSYPRSLLQLYLLDFHPICHSAWLSSFPATVDSYLAVLVFPIIASSPSRDLPCEQ